MKKLKTKTLALLLLLTSTSTVFGQTKINTEPERPFIEVTGTAELEIIPDEIYIAITIRERQDGKEKITIEKQEIDLKRALQSIGIPLENLSLSDANADYVRVSWTKKDVITKTEYILKVGDALTVGKVFEKLDELKIVDAYISHVSHSKIEEYKKEVRIMAIKAAKDKADYLLLAIGEQTGKPLKVYETNTNIDQSLLNVRGARGGKTEYYIDGYKSSSDKNEIIEFQKIKLQAAIYVKFEIK